MRRTHTAVGTKVTVLFPLETNTHVRALSKRPRTLEGCGSVIFLVARLKHTTYVSGDEDILSQ